MDDILARFSMIPSTFFLLLRRNSNRKYISATGGGLMVAGQTVHSTYDVITHYRLQAAVVSVIESVFPIYPLLGASG